MEKKIKISIIISVYNKLEQLKNILMALNIQEELPHEVIVADDGSSEKLEEKIIDIIPKLDYRLKHIYQEDKGFRLAASRNNGILCSEGEYLLFLDQDVLFDEKFLKTIKENIKEGEVLKINPLFLDQKRSEKITNKILEKKEYRYDYIKKELNGEDYKKIIKLNKADKRRNLLHRLRLNKRGAKIIGLAIGCFKESILKVNGFDEKYEGWGCEDDDLGNRLYALGHKVRAVEFENIVVHIWHPVSTNKGTNREYYLQQKKIILGKNQYMSEFGCSNRIEREMIKQRIVK